MNFNNRTTKASEAIQDANALAVRRQHGQIDVLHLFFSMLHQQEGYVPLLIQKVERDPIIIIQAIQKALDVLPTIDGNVQLSLSPSLNKVLVKSQDEMKTMGDHYLTTEHLLLASLQIDSPVKKICNEFGITETTIRSALSLMRNGSKIDSSDPETNLDALGKYGRDFTNLAREGKLDPII